MKSRTSPQAHEHFETRLGNQPRGGGCFGLCSGINQDMEGKPFPCNFYKSVILRFMREDATAPTQTLSLHRLVNKVRCKTPNCVHSGFRTKLRLYCGVHKPPKTSALKAGQIMTNPLMRWLYDNVSILELLQLSGFLVEGG